jgi:pimeloyl-ACP methyl ester carboxylesterase
MPTVAPTQAASGESTSEPQIVSDRQGPGRRTGMSQTTTSRDGTVIAYDRTGQGPAVVLIDGAIAHRGYRGGRPLAAELSRDFTVISYDRRGRGESGDTSPYAVEREIEDIEALVAEVGAPARLFGFSSGSILAVRAAATLGRKVARIAVFEPPLGSDDEPARQQFAEQLRQLEQLLREGRNGDAVAFFLQDMLPPEVLEGVKQSPDWPLMEAVAPTLAYDYRVLGDGGVPVQAARAVAVPALVLDGAESPPFKHEAADALAKALPNARRQTLAGQATQVPPEVLAPILGRFFDDR